MPDSPSQRPLAETPNVADRVGALNGAMRAIASRHAPTDGFHDTVVPGLQLIRSSAPTERIAALYRPALCVILGGRKRIFLNGQITDYPSDSHLVVSHDLPVLGQVIEASASQPYLSIYFMLEPAEVHDLMLQHGAPKEPLTTSQTARGMYIEATPDDLSDALWRLLKLLDSPQHAPALAPLIRREIVYRLMASPNGWRIARTARPDSNDQRVARAIALVRERFRESISIEDLTRAASMSASTMHAHFKAVTSFTPLTYIKQLRLQEARRLLISEGIDVAQAGHRVGYESPSHFSREYTRCFGIPPARDRNRQAALASPKSGADASGWSE